MTAIAGAATAADVSPGSSPAPVNTTASRVAFLENLAKETPASVELAPLPEADSPAPDVEEKAETTADPAGKPDEGKGDEGRTVPFAAFQKRLARERDKAKAAQEQLSARELELARATAAVDLLHDEYETLKAALVQVGIDPRDLALRENALTARAGERSRELAESHQRALEEQAAAYQRQSIQAQLREEIEAATEANPLVSFDELKAAMYRAKNTDAAAVASELQAQKLAIAAKLAPAPKPSHPRTAKAGAAGTMPRLENTTASRIAFLEALKAQTG